jgi:hypothetical protein
MRLQDENATKWTDDVEKSSLMSLDVVQCPFASEFGLHSPPSLSSLHQICPRRRHLNFDDNTTISIARSHTHQAPAGISFRNAKMGQSQSSSKKITAQDSAILSMKNQRDQLQKYQKKIVVVTERETEVARECLRRGDKKKALVALRRKKYQESLLAKTDAQLEQLEILVNDIEFARVQKDVIFGLQQGTNVLKQIHKEMGGVEGVEKLLSENEEAREYQKVSL